MLHAPLDPELLALLEEAVDERVLEEVFHELLQFVACVSGGEYADEVHVAAVADGWRFADAGQGEHARLVDGQVKGAGEDVQHGQLGTEERAAGRGQAPVPGNEGQECEAGLADLDCALAARSSTSAGGEHQHVRLAVVHRPGTGHVAGPGELMFVLGPRSLHLDDHGDVLFHCLKEKHAVRQQLLQHAGVTVGEIAVDDHRHCPRREPEPGAPKEHGDKLRLVAQDLDNGLVLKTWHEWRMPPRTDIAGRGIHSGPGKRPTGLII